MLGCCDRTLQEHDDDEPTPLFGWVWATDVARRLIAWVGHTEKETQDPCLIPTTGHALAQRPLPARRCAQPTEERPRELVFMWRACRWSSQRARGRNNNRGKSGPLSSG